MISPAREQFERAPFSMPQEEKRLWLTRAAAALSRHHYEACAPYRAVVDHVFGGRGALGGGRLEDLPFLPVSLFKTHALRSIPEEKVIKVLTSSGTTGQQVSRVYLDAETSQVQSTVLVRVAQQFLGRERLPMVVLDHPGVVRDRASYSARGAGILGMLQFGHRPFYALREDMSLDTDGLLAYLEAARGRRVLMFGFTWMVWQYFQGALASSGLRLQPGDAVLVHSGGWKKLADARVSPEQFRSRLLEVAGVRTVINFYGMVEQVGSVFFEDELGHLHAPVFSEVIVRDPVTLAPLPDGEPGLVQVVSSLPTSYPGHSLLTEDLGVVHGADLPGTVLKGRSFDILGRVPRADLRGCSDTFVAAAS